MRFNSKSIANFFLDLAASRGEQLDPMKLQKLVYYAHGWYAGYTGQPLIDGQVQAWRFGPVIAALYYEFREFGADPITSRAREWSPAVGLVIVPPPRDEQLQRFLTNVWKSYGGYTGIKLSEFTHARGGPWDQTRRNAGGAREAEIPFAVIQEHFAKVVEKAVQQA